MTDPDTVPFWPDVHDGQAGRPPLLGDEFDGPEQYAFDSIGGVVGDVRRGLRPVMCPSRGPQVGKRGREWIALGPTEATCVRDMANCLRSSGKALADVSVMPGYWAT